MADQEPTDNTGNWEPLKDYLQRKGLSRHMPFRVGHPVGEYRLDNLFAMERKRPEVFVRGFPKEIIGEPQLLPRGEFYGYIVDDRGAEYRLTHVASRVIWYVVEVLEEKETAATASCVALPAPVPPKEPTARSAPAPFVASASSDEDANDTDEAKVEKLISFLNARPKEKEIAVLALARARFPWWRRKLWRDARRGMLPVNKRGRGNPK